MSGSSFTFTFVPAPVPGAPVASQSFYTAGQRETLYCVIEYNDIRAKRATSNSVSTKGPLGSTVACDIVVTSPTSPTAATGSGGRSYGARPNSNGALTQYGPTSTTEPANSAVYVDPFTRDTVLDSNGKELGMDPVQQRIQILLNTRLGSIEADQSIGFLPPKKITSDVGRTLAVLVQRALKPMVDDNTIQLTKITAYIQQ